MRRIDKLYLKYEYLVDIYSSKVFNESRIAYERQDIKQDFREKLFKAICSYLRALDKAQSGNAEHPMPLDIYLKTVMNNFVRDFITKINRLKNSMIDVGFESLDYGATTREAVTDLSSLFNFQGDLKLLVDGMDLVGNLERREDKIAFLMYLKGYSHTLINKALKIDSRTIVDRQITYLRSLKEEFDLKEREFFITATVVENQF